ncbi:MAG: tetratricopeptide repeat protein [Gemmatimonadaceae bacterium]|nr:tetratricopeptide repeat protein [Gemmatimonadaceae bacterium]
MAIRGSLKEASLPDVLQLLSMGKKSGCLSVTHRSNFGSIFFDKGRICYASIVNRRDRLGDILVKSGLLQQEQLDEAIRLQDKARGRRLGELLVEHGMISKEELHAQIRIQIEEAVYYLFTWAEGTFNFESDIRPEEQDFLVSINPESLLLEGARRVDEWGLIEKKIPSFDLVFEVDRRKADEYDDKLTPEQHTLLQLIDGRRDVHALVDESGLVEFEVGKALFGLATAGLLHRVGKTKPAEEVAAEQRVEEHRNLGVAFYKTGMLDEAVREFRRVAELRPDDLGARFHLGLAHLRLGKWAEALTHLEAAARHRSATYAVLHDLALALEKLGRIEEARRTLEEALTRGGQAEPRIHVSLGLLALREGRFTDADLHLAEARPHFGARPPSPLWYHAAGLAAALTGQTEKTVLLLSEGVQRHPHAAGLYNNLAVAFAVGGALEEALQTVERGIQEDPALAPLHRNRGDLLIQLGQSDAALDAYLRAVKHHETLGPEVWARIGGLREAAGEVTEARVAWERALVLDPGHTEARERLATGRAPR